MTSDRFIVDLDFGDGDLALSFAQRLGSAVRTVRVGAPLLLGAGPGLIESLRRQGYWVLLDLALHGTPQAVESAVHTAARRGARFISVFAGCSVECLRAAQSGLSNLTVVPGETPPGLIARLDLVLDAIPSQRTALSRRDLAQHWIDHLSLAGIEGAIAAAEDIALLAELMGPEVTLICDETRQECPPTATDRRGFFEHGASHALVGPSLRSSADPSSQLARMIEDIGHVTA